MAYLHGLAGQFEQLIARYKSDPWVPLAMYELAGIYASMRDQESRPVENSRESAIKWYRRAIEAGKAKCKVSLDAKLGLAQQLRASDDDPEALREARELSESVAELASGNPELLAKAHSHLVRQCLKEKQYERAEVLCRELLAWPADRKSALVQTSQRSAATALIQGMVYRESQTADEKQTWLDQFAQQADQLPWLKPEIELANRQLSAFKSMNPARVPLESKSSGYRAFFLATNVLVFVVVSGLLLRKLLANRRSMEAPA